MRCVIIDCTNISTREALCDAIAKHLKTPVWFGRNLDALHDCLCTLSGTLRLEHWAEAETALGKYGTAARRAIAAAGLENTKLDIIF